MKGKRNRKKKMWTPSIYASEGRDEKTQSQLVRRGSFRKKPQDFLLQ